MAEFDSNNQASSSQSAQTAAAGPVASGQASPSASFNTNAVPYVPPTTLTLQQVIDMQASPSLSAEQADTVGETDATLQGY
jgi:hypothetical protein